jgi:hypothetical protein
MIGCAHVELADQNIAIQHDLVLNDNHNGEEKTFTSFIQKWLRLAFKRAGYDFQQMDEQIYMQEVLLEPFRFLALDRDL